jgi:hypothetical protein
MTIKYSDESSEKAKNSWARRATTVVLINIAVLASLLFAMEVGFRLFRPGYEFYSRTQPGQFEDRTFRAGRFRKDTDLGWVLSGDTSDWYKPKGLKQPTYIANGQGFRDTKNFATIDYHSGKRRVVMLGDSFLFGVDLDAQETIPAILERKLPGYELYNLGIPGWGLDQMYLSYKKYVTLIKPQIVVLLYIDDDLSRIYEAFRVMDGMNKPSFSLQGNRLVPRTPLSLWKRYFHNYVINYSIIANRFYIFYKNIEIKKLVEALFADLIAQTLQSGQELIVLRLPVLRGGFPDSDHRLTWGTRRMWNFKDFFAEKNILYIDVGDQMPRDEKFYQPDQHFSAVGTAYVAELISKLDVFTRRRNPHSP